MISGNLQSIKSKIDLLFQIAIAAKEQHKYDLAVKKFTEIIHYSRLMNLPSLGRALLGRSLVYRILNNNVAAQNDKDESEKLLSEIFIDKLLEEAQLEWKIESVKSSKPIEFDAVNARKACAITRLAMNSLIAGNFLEALNHAYDALAFYPLTKAELIRCKCLVNTGLFSEAIDGLKNLINKEDATTVTMAYFDLGVALLNIGDFKESRKNFFYGMRSQTTAPVIDKDEANFSLDKWIACEISYLAAENKESKIEPVMPDNKDSSLLKDAAFFAARAESFEASGNLDEAINARTVSIWLLACKIDTDNQKLMFESLDRRRTLFLKQYLTGDATVDTEQMLNLVGVQKTVIRNKAVNEFIQLAPDASPQHKIYFYAYALHLLNVTFPENANFIFSGKFAQFKTRYGREQFVNTASNNEIDLMLHKFTQHFLRGMEGLEQYTSAHAHLLARRDLYKDNEEPSKPKPKKKKPKTNILKIPPKSNQPPEVKALVAQEKKLFLAERAKDREKQKAEAEQAEKASRLLVQQMEEQEREEKNQRKKQSAEEKTTTLETKKLEEKNKMLEAAKKSAKAQAEKIAKEKEQAVKKAEESKQKAIEREKARQAVLEKIKLEAERIKKMFEEKDAKDKNKLERPKPELGVEQPITEQPGSSSPVPLTKITYKIPNAEAKLENYHLNILTRILEQRKIHSQINYEDSLTFIYDHIARFYYNNINIPTGFNILTDATEKEIKDAFSTSDIKECKEIPGCHLGQLFSITFQDNSQIQVIRGKELIKQEIPLELRLLAQASLFTFTLEALFLKFNGEFYAPLAETIQDCATKSLRTVTDPWILFANDPILIFQAVFFLEYLATQANLPPEIESACITNAYRLNNANISKAQINTLLTRLFDSPYAKNSYNILLKLGILDTLFPILASSLVADNDWLQNEFSIEGLNQNYIYMHFLVSMAAQNQVYGQTIYYTLDLYLENNPIFKINFDGFKEKFGALVFKQMQESVISKWYAAHPVQASIPMMVPSHVPGSFIYPMAFWGGANVLPEQQLQQFTPTFSPG